MTRKFTRRNALGFIAIGSVSVLAAACGGPGSWRRPGASRPAWRPRRPVGASVGLAAGAAVGAAAAGLGASAAFGAAVGLGAGLLHAAVKSHQTIMAMKPKGLLRLVNLRVTVNSPSCSLARPRNARVTDYDALGSVLRSLLGQIPPVQLDHVEPRALVFRDGDVASTATSSRRWRRRPAGCSARSRAALSEGRRDGRRPGRCHGSTSGRCRWSEDASRRCPCPGSRPRT